jgi:hypothetical protein
VKMRKTIPGRWLVKQRTGEKKVEKTLIFALDTSTETWYVDLVKRVG